MKTRKTLVVILFIFFLNSCITIYPRFEDSNQLFIEKTVSKIDLSSIVKSQIPYGSKVSLVSIETKETIDKPIVAMIEDQLIQSLIDNGYKVLERDAHSIKNLIREKLNKNYSLYFGDKNIEIKPSSENIDNLIFLETQLSSADYIIAYRILECGLLYRDKDAKQNLREGLVRLHIRVYDTSNGQILIAKNVNGKFTDTIRKEFVNQLANFHYSYFPYDYPLQPKEMVHLKKLAPTSENYFYFAPSAGLGFSQGGEEFVLGGTIGYGGKSWGRVGANIIFAME